MKSGMVGRGPLYFCSTRAGVLAMPDTGSSGAVLVGELEGGLGKNTQIGVLTSLGVLVTQGQSWFTSWKVV